MAFDDPGLSRSPFSFRRPRGIHLQGSLQSKDAGTVPSEFTEGRPGGLERSLSGYDQAADRAFLSMAVTNTSVTCNLTYRRSVIVAAEAVSTTRAIMVGLAIVTAEMVAAVITMVAAVVIAMVVAIVRAAIVAVSVPATPFELWANVIRLTADGLTANRLAIILVAADGLAAHWFAVIFVAADSLTANRPAIMLFAADWLAVGLVAARLTVNRLTVGLVTARPAVARIAVAVHNSFRNPDGSSRDSSHGTRGCSDSTNGRCGSRNWVLSYGSGRNNQTNDFCRANHCSARRSNAGHHQNAHRHPPWPPLTWGPKTWPDLQKQSRPTRYSLCVTYDPPLRDLPFGIGMGRPSSRPPHLSKAWVDLVCYKGNRFCQSADSGPAVQRTGRGIAVRDSGGRRIELHSQMIAKCTWSA